MSPNAKNYYTPNNTLQDPRGSKKKLVENSAPYSYQEMVHILSTFNVLSLDAATISSIVDQISHPNFFTNSWSMKLWEFLVAIKIWGGFME